MILSAALTEGQIALITEKTEEILERTGLTRDSSRAAGALPGGRRAVDEVECRVRFPRPVLRELLAAVPATYTIAGPGGLRHVVGDNAAPPACQAIVTDPWIDRLRHGEPRRPRLDDLRRHTAIVQSLADGGCHQPDGLPADRCA